MGKKKPLRKLETLKWRMGLISHVHCTIDFRLFNARFSIYCLHHSKKRGTSNANFLRIVQDRHKKRHLTKNTLSGVSDFVSRSSIRR